MTLHRRFLAVSGATALYVGVSAAAYSIFKPEPKGGGDTASFDGLADNYDSLVDREETFMGLKLLRWWLVRQAKGDTLEISAGTGRNLQYYQHDSISSLTLTDTSSQMLWHAAQKQRQLPPTGHSPVCFRVADAARVRSAGSLTDLPTFSSHASSASISSDNSSSGNDSNPGAASNASTSAVGTAYPTSSNNPPSRQLYDTIIDTFGLCSHEDPVEVLREASRACKKDGRILLLEHGRSSYNWLNRILDDGAVRHCRRWACNWNLDITEIVQQAGLQIVHSSRWHFGTTYVVIAEPAPA